MSHSYKETSELGKGFVLFLIIVLIGIFGLHACTTSLAQGNKHTEVVTVCDKGSVQTGRGGRRSHESRVGTTRGAHVVKDYFGSEGTRFNSADLYGRIVIGKTYIIKSYGYRVPWASNFWNITEVTPTDQKPTGTCG